MQTLSQEEHLALLDGAAILSKDKFGAKVVQLKDGSVLKLFRVKRLLSSARFYPYSVRFVHNARKLSELNIPTVEVINTFKIPSIKRTAVQYEMMEGEILPDYLKNGRFTKEIAQQFAAFIASLHNSGIYFRSIHLKNIVVLPDQRFGLIDIADMKTFPRALSPRMRARNFRHLMRYPVHRKQLEPEIMTFMHSYFSQCSFSQRRENRLRPKLLKRLQGL